MGAEKEDFRVKNGDFRFGSSRSLLISSLLLKGEVLGAKKWDFGVLGRENGHFWVWGVESVRIMTVLWGRKAEIWGFFRARNGVF